MTMLRMIFSVLPVFVASHVLAQVGWRDSYEPRVFDGMPIRVMKPIAMEEGVKYPVILSLHGAGGKGTDNAKQLKDWNRQLADDTLRQGFPSYVVAPQAQGLWDAEDLTRIQALIEELPAVDLDRIYVLGHSMGGHGTYIFIQLSPDYFAAAAPSAGSGLQRTADFIAPAKIKHLPIWAFHGDEDRVCPLQKDEEVFNEMKRIGGKMKLTVWEGDGHGVSGKMIPGAANGTTSLSSDACDAEPDFMTWLFSNSKQSALNDPSES